MEKNDGFDSMIYGLDLGTKKDKIVCLVGASSSGKTTIAKELEKLGYNIIESYTTRSAREIGEWGHTFLRDWFGSYTNGVFTGVEKPTPEGDGLIGYIDIDEMIAHFNDYEKDEHYFATYEQYQGKGTSIYIVDPQGAEQVKENVKDAEVITIFLMADEKERRLRMAERQMTNIPNTLDRAEKDREIFKTCKCDYVIDANREVEEVLKDVVDIIE